MYKIRRKDTKKNWNTQEKNIKIARLSDFSLLTAFLCAGMCLHIHVFYLLKSGVRIDLRGTQGRVPEKGLNRPNVCAVVQHCGRKSVT